MAKRTIETQIRLSQSLLQKAKSRCQSSVDIYPVNKKQVVGNSFIIQSISNLNIPIKRGSPQPIYRKKLVEKRLRQIDNLKVIKKSNSFGRNNFVDNEMSPWQTGEKEIIVEPLRIPTLKLKQRYKESFSPDSCKTKFPLSTKRQYLQGREKRLVKLDQALSVIRQKDEPDETPVFRRLKPTLLKRSHSEIRKRMIRKSFIDDQFMKRVQLKFPR